MGEQQPTTPVRSATIANVGFRSSRPCFCLGDLSSLLWIGDFDGKETYNKAFAVSNTNNESTSTPQQIQYANSFQAWELLLDCKTVSVWSPQAEGYSGCFDASFSQGKDLSSRKGRSHETRTSANLVRFTALATRSTSSKRKPEMIAADRLF